MLHSVTKHAGVPYCQNVTLFHGTRVPVIVFMSTRKARLCLQRHLRNSQILRSSVCDHQNPSRNTKILHVQCPSFLPDLNKTWIFCTYFLKIFKYKISLKSIQRKPRCPCVRAGGQKGTMARLRPGAHWDAGGRRAGQHRAGRRSTGNTAWHSVSAYWDAGGRRAGRGSTGNTAWQSVSAHWEVVSCNLAKWAMAEFIALNFKL